MAGGLAGWLPGWLGQLAGWLAGLLDGRPVWMAGWLAGRPSSNPSQIACKSQYARFLYAKRRFVAFCVRMPGLREKYL